MKNTSRQNSLILLSCLLIVIFFLEILLRISIMYFTVDINLLRIFLFSLSYAFFLLFVLRFFKMKSMKVISFVIVISLSFLYFAQDMYFRIFNGFFSFAITGDALLGVTFLGRFIHKISLIHLLYLLPTIILVLVIKYSKNAHHAIYNVQYKRLYQPLIVFGFAIGILMLSQVTIPKTSIVSSQSSEYNYSDFDLYEEPYSPYLAIKKFGLFTYIRIDLESNLNSDLPLDEVDSEIAEFLANLPEHETNDYTGYFEDKNFILIMAESLDTYALDPEIMPNLTALLEHSWYFENYYSPLYYRNTADTEFMTQTSFYPHNGVELSMEAFADNTFMYTLPKMFIEQGYDTIAFHDYTDYFYPRSEFDPNTLGYQNYYGATDMGLLEEQTGYVGDHEWPSDVLMMEQVLEKLADEEQFFTYILTVSGHLPYDSSHEIAVKNLDTVTNIFIDNDRKLPPESILYYLAAQYEFDQSLGTLINGLSESGQLEDTVIMIYGDHYAYGLDLEDIWKYDTIKETKSTIDIHNVPMLIYNPDLEPQIISNTMSSIDIMPTLSNLFSLNIDYQKVMGCDALDDISNVVMLSNGSIVSDHFSYNIETDQYTFFDDEVTLDEAYVTNNYMIHKKSISNMILETNYFYAERIALFFYQEERRFF